jgi:hypothetical protein
MSGSTTLLCPECGTTSKSERTLRRRRRPRVLLRMGLLLALAGAVLACVNPVQRDGWAAPVPLVVLRQVAPFFDDEGKRLVSPISPAWLTGSLMTAMAGQYGPNSPTQQAFASMLPTVTLPTRWERVLLARQGELAAERLLDPSLTVVSSAADAWLLRDISRLLREDELALLSPAAERLIESPFEFQQTYAMTFLRRTAPGSGTRLERIAELARTSASVTLRKYAFETAVVVADSPTAAAAALTPGLRDADGQIRLVCAGHLQKLGPHAVAALPELDRLAASDPDVWIQAAAKMAAEVIRRERRE